ncbi:MAG: DNA-3-methyladenine glycosylase [Acidobacteriota bacterium]
MLLGPLELLPPSFYSRPTRAVARDLLGCLLVRQLNGERLSGVIVEAEAYIGESDLACHAKAGRTARTEVMYGRAGFSYVYFTYGMHWMLNVVTEEEGFPAAVLIRAIEPVEGVEVMKQLRQKTRETDLCSGPARLTQALSIARRHNGLDLCRASSELWIERGDSESKKRIQATPRIGLGGTPEPWLSKPWRYFLAGNPHVSR